jgi:SAM-dependent methyltransferase
MPDKDRNFAGSIPDVYDDHLVPLIFESYASDMARRVAARRPRAVLETAAGSGVVTRALAPLLDATARYVVTDLNQPMLDRAARRQSEATRLEWRQADALTLPFEAGTFDVVCCQFGAMFFPDRVAGYREALRVLRDGGAFIFNVWDRIEANDFARSVTETAARLFPEDPPDFLARIPHGYHDVGKIEADLAAAGFGGIDIETIEASSRADSPEVPAIAYCQGTPLRNALESRAGVTLAEATDAAARDIAARFGSGPVSGRIRGHVVTATA